MKIINALISAVYPNACAGCCKIIDEGEFVCDYCSEMLEYFALDKICIKCGLPKKQCECKRYIFSFDGCVAPFKNDGIARKMMHYFKFRHYERLSRFFAENMALTVKQSFFDLDFDIITYVPLTVFHELNRGYNQTLILAKELSNILSIPLEENVIYCSKKRRSQHKLSSKERFENIKGMYYCRKSLYGKRILLVDDIKTTGATLNECSKQLLAAGANSVYCVTALITENKKLKGK